MGEKEKGKKGKEMLGTMDAALKPEEHGWSQPIEGKNQVWWVLPSDKGAKEFSEYSCRSELYVLQMVSETCANTQYEGASVVFG